MRRDEVLGAWELVSYTSGDDPDGSLVHPLGPDATGLLIYTPDGYMSVQILRRDRPEFDRPDPEGGTTEQAATAASGYLAYSGPFEINQDAGVLHHEVAVSLLPNWLNRTQVRDSTSMGIT
jgi:hypothetical protein